MSVCLGSATIEPIRLYGGVWRRVGGYALNGNTKTRDGQNIEAAESVPPKKRVFSNGLAARRPPLSPQRHFDSKKEVGPGVGGLGGVRRGPQRRPYAAPPKATSHQDDRVIGRGTDRERRCPVSRVKSAEKAYAALMRCSGFADPADAAGARLPRREALPATSARHRSRSTGTSQNERLASAWAMPLNPKSFSMRSSMPRRRRRSRRTRRATLKARRKRAHLPGFDRSWGSNFAVAGFDIALLLDGGQAACGA